MKHKLMNIPPSGIAKDQLLQKMESLQEKDANWREGKTWSLVYYAGEEITAVAREAYNKFFHCNALNPTAFTSLRTFEAEVVSMAADLLGGDEETAGSLTSGGTESILMAVKTARDKALAERPHITLPEMVLPESAHPAFLKAAHYLGVKPVRIPLREDYRVDVDAAAKAVTDNTVLLVGSAPAYPHGVIDPIEELAIIARETGIYFHVDACLGGFLLPFIKELGYPVPAFDFNVPEVTSISADIHKYGFAAKGASVILYRNREIRRHQFFAFADWPGGLFVSPTMTGTRPGGAIAAAWAVMNYLGREGYRKLAERIMSTTKELQEGIAAIPGLYVLGRPDMSVFAFSSRDTDIYALAAAMEEKGWHMDCQQLPPSLHVMVTPAHESIATTFLQDLRECTKTIKAAGTSAHSQGTAAFYGMLGTMPNRDKAYDFLIDFMDTISQPKKVTIRDSES